MINDYLLTPHIKNGVLSIKNLRESNYPLYLYVMDNIKYIEEGTDFLVLNELKSLRGAKQLKAYLKYYYGDKVNVTKVRADNVTVYNYLCFLGVPEEVVNEMGFYVEYDRKITMDELRKELDEISVDGLVGKLTKKLENKLYYEANKRGITTMQYLNELGYTPSYGGLEYIQRQKKWLKQSRNIILYENVTVSKELPKARKGTKGVVIGILENKEINELEYLVEITDPEGIKEEKVFSRNELKIDITEDKEYLEKIHGKPYEELAKEVWDGKSRKNKR